MIQEFWFQFPAVTSTPCVLVGMSLNPFYASIPSLCNGKYTTSFLLSFLVVVFYLDHKQFGAGIVVLCMWTVPSTMGPQLGLVPLDTLVVIIISNRSKYRGVWK